MRHWKTLLTGLLALCLLMVGRAALADTGTLRLPNSTKTIEAEAFYGDTSLNNVTLPDGLTRIDARAFANSSVKSINLPDSITYIDDTAFDQSALESVSATEGSYAYEWAVKRGFIQNPYNPASDFEYEIVDGKCTIKKYIGNASVVHIPSSINGYIVTTIGIYAFRDNKIVTSIVIPESVTDIEEQAFAWCENLTKINIPNSVSVINANTFSGCNGLKNISIPNSITSIGSCAFSNCDGLTEIVIPSSVTIFGNRAFSRCYNLRSVILSDGMSRLVFTNPYYYPESGIFPCCPNLNSITIPKTVTVISDEVFGNSLYWGSEMGYFTPPKIVYCESGSYAENWVSKQLSSFGTTIVPIEEEPLTMTFPKEIHLGAGCIMKVTASFSDGKHHNYYLSSDDSTIASVDSTNSTVMAGKSIARTKIYCTVIDGSVPPASCTVYVDSQITEGAGNNPISEVHLCVGETRKVHYGYAIYVGSSSYPSKEHWSSNDKDIADFDQSGALIGKKVGETYITCSDSGKGLLTFCNVIVSQAPAEISLSPKDMMLGVDESLQITASTPENIWKNFTYMSSDPSVAVVSKDGIVTGKSFGNTVITVSAGNVSKTLRVIVKNKPSKINITPKNLEVIWGLSGKVNVSFGLNEYGVVKYKSSNNSVASIDSKGNVYGVGTGTAVITATTYVSGLSATCNVTVVINEQYEAWKAATNEIQKMPNKATQMQKLTVRFGELYDKEYSKYSRKEQDANDGLVAKIQKAFLRPDTADVLPSNLETEYRKMPEDVYNWIISVFADTYKEAVRNSKEYKKLSEMSSEKEIIAAAYNRAFQGSEELTYKRPKDGATYTWTFVKLGGGIGAPLQMGTVKGKLKNNYEITYAAIITTSNTDSSGIKAFLDELHEFAEKKLDEAKDAFTEDVGQLLIDSVFLDTRVLKVVEALNGLSKYTGVKYMLSENSAFKTCYDELIIMANTYKDLQKEYDTVKSFVNSDWKDVAIDQLNKDMRGFRAKLSKWDKEIDNAIKILGVS